MADNRGGGGGRVATGFGGRRWLCRRVEIDVCRRARYRGGGVGGNNIKYGINYIG